MGLVMRCVGVMLWMALLSGCQLTAGQIYRTAGNIDESTFLPVVGDQPMKATGAVPVRVLLLELEAMGVVHSRPPGEVSGQELLVRDWKVRDAVVAIERAQGWAFDGESGSFYVARATHGLDGPDDFGRATASDRVPTGVRPHVSVGLRFRRLSAGVSANKTIAVGVSGSGAQTVFYGSVPDGVEATWSSSQERSYFRGVRDPAAGASVRQVETERQAVSAGLMVSSLAARLPGGNFRLSGNFELSHFVGGGLDKAVYQQQLQVDGPRGVWVPVVMITGMDANADVVFRHFGFSAKASGDRIEFSVRVD